MLQILAIDIGTDLLPALALGAEPEGIAVPSEFKKTDDGPGLVVEYDDAELPLGAYLAAAGAELSFEDRIALAQRLEERSGLRTARGSGRGSRTVGRQPRERRL
ncbi:hypothetical protein GCM10009609_47440 [Pseudonocardia aurantiaca]|uniref:Uncharacterized protein n=1 Tax=Pseudonocardia aurantiaca TaxID=75290 RepID=A0ABW4FWQ1_9PSEU